METLDSLGHRYGTDKASGSHNYLHFYQRFLDPMRKKDITLLEIGIGDGASLCMWRDFFRRGRIVGLDVDARRATAAIGGEGKRAEVDGGYFGGYVKPANKRENRVDRRLRQHQTGKRKVVVVIRERGGKTLPGVFRSEIEALSFIRRQLPASTTLYADEAGSWNELHARYTLHRINHQEAYSLGGPDEINTNQAESFFSRMRRAEIGHHHHIAGPYLLRFAQEASWREDHRREPNGSQVDRIVALAMANKPSVDFCGYWQRAHNPAQ